MCRKIRISTGVPCRQEPLELARNHGRGNAHPLHKRTLGGAASRQKHCIRFDSIFASGRQIQSMLDRDTRR